MFLPIEATPYVRLVKRLFSGPGLLRDIAYQQDILCPEEKVTAHPSIFLPGQIERIKDFKPTDAVAITTKEAEIEAAISTTGIHRSTIAYHIKNAVLFDGAVYAGRFKHVVGDKALYTSPLNQRRHIKTAALASSYVGTKYFGHWLTDDCTQYILAEEIAQPLCVRTASFGHRQGYQTYFGQDWTPTDRAHIDDLIVFQDFSQNSFKRKRYRALRDRIKARFPDNGSRLCIYLRRGKTGIRRAIQNENEIIDALTRRDFVVVDVESDSLDHIIGTLVHAKIVVSMEGSHVAHCTFTSPENSGVLLLQPADRFSAVHRGWSECLGIRFGFVVGVTGEAGYYFPVPEVLSTIDLMLNQLEA